MMSNGPSSWCVPGGVTPVCSCAREYFVLTCMEWRAVEQGRQKRGRVQRCAARTRKSLRGGALYGAHYAHCRAARPRHCHGPLAAMVLGEVPYELHLRHRGRHLQALRHWGLELCPVLFPAGVARAFSLRPSTLRPSPPLSLKHTRTHQTACMQGVHHGAMHLCICAPHCECI